MEVWKIVVLIVIIILLTLGSWYVIKLKYKELKDRMYINLKDGRQYIPLYKCRMKCSASDEWLDALIYQDYDDGHLYVRDIKDFRETFVKLTEHNNGNKIKS